MPVQLSRASTLANFQDATTRFAVNATLYPGVSFPATVAAASSADSDVISAGDSNSFMVWLDFSGAGTATVSFFHVHPTTFAQISALAQIATGLAASGANTLGFGASTAINAGDVFLAFKVRVAAVAAAITVNNLAILATRR
jgi:hypothetical protein